MKRMTCALLLAVFAVGCGTDTSKNTNLPGPNPPPPPSRMQKKNSTVVNPGTHK